MTPLATNLFPCNNLIHFVTNLVNKWRQIDINGRFVKLNVPDGTWDLLLLKLYSSNLHWYALRRPQKKKLVFLPPLKQSDYILHLKKQIDFLPNNINIALQLFCLIVVSIYDSSQEIFLPSHAICITCKFTSSFVLPISCE